MGTNTEKGEFGERFAETYLTNKGFRILDRNYRFEHAEIDLIGMDGSELVFVEVKYREQKNFGDPLEAITDQKIKRLYKAAEHWLEEHELKQESARFDILGLQKNGSYISVEHLEDAITHRDYREET